MKDITLLDHESFAKEMQAIPKEHRVLAQVGDDNFYVEEIANFNKTENIYCVLPQNLEHDSGMLRRKLDTSYYHLVVIGGSEFRQFTAGHCSIIKSKALTEDVASDIKESIQTLTTEAIERIIHFPAIFANLNTVAGLSDESQYAFFGFITNITIQDMDVKLDFQLLNAIPQLTLNELLEELEIKGHDENNEFDNTHWTVKKLDVVRVLRDNGVSVFAP